MFIRVKTTPNSPRKSIQIVENVRAGDKVKQKIVRYVGIAMNDDEEQKLRVLAEGIMVTLIQEQESKKGTLFDFSEEDAQDKIKRGRKKLKKIEDILPADQVLACDLVEEKRINEGVDDIAGSVYDSFGFNQLFKGVRNQTLLKDLILARLIYPQSKYKLCSTMFDQFDKQYNEDQIYRLMDNLYPKIDQIKLNIFNKTKELAPKIDVILFDVTTLYIESQVADELREFGFSKDGKFNNTQLVLALATNELGLPVGYELFQGNCAEVKTLLESINKWKKLFKIDNACFIGDRAMFCHENIKLIEENNYQYIIAAKLRSLPEELQEKILNKDNYEPTKFSSEDGSINEFEYYPLHQIGCTIIEQESRLTEYSWHNGNYIVIGSKGKIQNIIYRNHNGVITYADTNKLNEYLAELNNLRVFVQRCPVKLMTEEEYQFNLPNLQANDVIAITCPENTYLYRNNIKVNIDCLNNKQQEQVKQNINSGRLLNSIMKVLFADYQSIYKINLPIEWLKELFPQNNHFRRRLCVSYKPSRAKNDAYKRDKILAKLENKQGKTDKILKTAARLYMSSSGIAKIDEYKIEQARRWDGLHGVITNIYDNGIVEILNRYSNLWRIEEAFRINKHNLGMRPIYHYKPERIKTHIAICYMAFAILKLIQYQTQLTQPRYTINNILDVMLSVQSSIYVHRRTQDKYKIPGCMSHLATALYRAFGLKRSREIAIYQN